MQIPEFEKIILARFFAPFIYEFFASEEGQKEYEEWLKAQQKADLKNNKEEGHDWAKVMIELRSDNHPVVPFDYLSNPNTKIDVFDFEYTSYGDSKERI